MRVGFVRKAGLSAVILAAAALGACNDDPTSWDTNDTTDLFVNPTVMVVPAGRDAKLESRAVNPGNEPTFADVGWAIDPTAGCVDSGVGVGTVDVIEDPDALPIQPPGLFEVTGGTTMGQTCIVLTTGSVTQTVKVNVVAEAIVILGAPETLEFGTTVQLNAQLIDFAELPDTPEIVTPFDITDATWSSDEPGIATVDENGLVTAVAAGVATISACWSGTAGTGSGGLGYEVCDEVAIEVVVPPPTAVAIDPASGLVGEVVTLDITGLLPPHAVFIDGLELNSIFIETRTEDQIVFWYPFSGIGEHEVTVGVPGVTSDPVTFELTSAGSSDDPDYLDPGTAPLTAIPFKKVAYLDADVVDHFYLVEVGAATTIVIDLDWDSGADLDILVTDGAFTAFVCTDGATGAQPEQSTCALPEAGQYLVWINSYDAAAGTYVLETAVQ
jgi:hypothetical protein